MVQLTKGVARVAGWGQERWLGGQNQDSWLWALRLQGGLVESRWRSFENIRASSLSPGQWCRRDQAPGETSYHENPRLVLIRTISRNYFVSHSLLPMLCLDTGCDDVMGGCRIIQTGALPCPPRCTLLQKCTPLDSRNAFSGKDWIQINESDLCFDPQLRNKKGKYSFKKENKGFTTGSLSRILSQGSTMMKSFCFYISEFILSLEILIIQ